MKPTAKKRPGARLGARLALLAALALSALALSAAPASAAITYSGHSIGPCGVGCGEFARPMALAVDHSTGDLYVYDIEAKHTYSDSIHGELETRGAIYRFDSEGEPLPFSASQLYVQGNAIIGQPNPNGNTALQGISGNNDVNQLAIDESTGPTAGDIYLADGIEMLIFGPDGSFRNPLDSGEGFGNPTGVAITPSGAVYVANQEKHRIERFTPTGSENGASQADYSLFESVTYAPANLALDPAGDLYAANLITGPIHRYTPGGESHGTFGSNNIYGISLNPAAGHLFDVNDPVYSKFEGHRLSEYDPSSGALLGSLTLPVGAYGVAADGTTVYVDHNNVPFSFEGPGEPANSGLVDVYTAPPAFPPSIDSTSVAAVTSTTADLRAQIDAHGFDTHYRFEYLTAQALERNEAEGAEPFGGAARIPTEAQGEADLGSNNEDRLAAQHLTGLAPAAAYRYRVIAESEVGGPQTGPVRSFTTQSALYPSSLPDHRVWEMVSPIDKNGGSVLPPGTISAGGVAQAAPDGGSVTWVSTAAFAGSDGAPAASQYLSSRRPAGWSTANISSPTVDSETFNTGGGTPYKAFSSDLSLGFEKASYPLSAEALPEYPNWYLRDTTQPPSYQPLLTAADSSPSRAVPSHFVGASPDLGHLLLSTPAALTPDTVDSGNENLYEFSRSSAALRPINFLPGLSQATPGATVATSRTGVIASYASHAVSADGERVYFSTRDHLYLRQNATQPQSALDSQGNCTEPTMACTYQLDLPQAGASAAGNVAPEFQLASATGSVAFFTDPQRLTSDAPPGGIGDAELYRFTAGAPAGERLTDLTPVASGAEVQGVLGASEDGSYLYFVARGVLAGSNAEGRAPTPGHENLYLWHDDGTPRGSIAFIASLSPQDFFDWGPSGQPPRATSRVTPDGLHLAFLSSNSLTAYDNTIAAGTSCGVRQGFPQPPACREVYLYDASANHLTCVSCDPTGAQPIGPASIPGLSPFESVGGIYQPRFLATTGDRLFFESPDPLAPADVNAATDVYEWEAPGTGTCSESDPTYSASDGGCLALVSSGTNPQPSEFIDASESGDDVFFRTTASLIPQDPGSYDLYDARVNGTGAPPLPRESACQGDACQQPATAPNDPTPASLTYHGPGNQHPAAPCRRPRLRRHGRCLRPHRHRHHRSHRGGRR